MTPTMMKTKVGLGKLVLFSGGGIGDFICVLDAGCGSSGDLDKEVPHGGGYLLEVGFEGEVACVQKLNGGIGVIARIGFCARRDEERIVLAPDCEKRRLRFAEVLLKGRVEF